MKDWRRKVPEKGVRNFKLALGDFPKHNGVEKKNQSGVRSRNIKWGSQEQGVWGD